MGLLEIRRFEYRFLLFRQILNGQIRIRPVDAGF